MGSLDMQASVNTALRSPALTGRAEESMHCRAMLFANTALEHGCMGPDLLTYLPTLKSQTVLYRQSADGNVGRIIMCTKQLNTTNLTFIYDRVFVDRFK